MGDGSAGRRGTSQVRLRLGEVEIAVQGESREDCWRQLEAAVQDLERAVRELPVPPVQPYRPTAAGEAYLAGYREAQDANGSTPAEGR